MSHYSEKFKLTSGQLDQMKASYENNVYCQFFKGFGVLFNKLFYINLFAIYYVK